MKRQTGCKKSVCGYEKNALSRVGPRSDLVLKNPDAGGRIRRTDRICDTVVGISRFQQSVLHQGKIEQYFLDFIHGNSDIDVERLKEPVRLEIDELLVRSKHRYPIAAEIQCVELNHTVQAMGIASRAGQGPRGSLEVRKPSVDDREEGFNGELIHCKYMIGCDGAHSWVRERLGFVMEGEQTDSVWGVMDLVPITNFRKSKTPTMCVAKR